jgi:hypothetical protein
MQLSGNCYLDSLECPQSKSNFNQKLFCSLSNKKTVKMITIQKLKVYEKYSGDEDHLTRMAIETELKLFDKNSDWFEIMNFKQDIIMISQNLPSEEYRKSSIERMKNLCDTEAFEMLTKSILS